MHFAIPWQYQHRVLFLGILGVTFGLIAAGVAVSLGKTSTTSRVALNP